MNDTIDPSIKAKQLCTGKFLIFTLADEEYGFHIRHVKEIIAMMPITVVPQTPDFVKGVMNLRGKVIPVIDLRSRFLMESICYTDRSCIIIVEDHTGEHETFVGIVVDAVSEVLSIDENEIEQTPSFGGQLDTRFILCMANMNDSVKILLNTEQILQIKDPVSDE